MKIALAFIFIFVYWCLDSAYTSSILSLSFSKSFFQTNLISKAFVTLMSLVFTITSLKKDKIQEYKVEKDREFQIYKKVSQIITSPLSISIQANQIVTLLESQYQFACSFICEYQIDNIKVLNEKGNFQNFGIKSHYNPHRETFSKGSIEEMLSLFYIEKRDFSQMQVQTSNGILEGYFHALMTHESSKPLGVFVILSKTQNNYEHISKSISSLIAFSLFLYQRKVANEKFQKELLQKDEILNIPTNTVLQTIIQQEYNRFLRYGTNLSLIIFEIDYLENLQNVFDKATILQLQKELIQITSKNIRSNDILGKWTKNRFAIVASNIDFRSAKNFIFKLRHVLSEQRFQKVGKVTCSFGATSLSKDDTILQFRQRAEEALHAALEKGTNSYELKVIV